MEARAIGMLRLGAWINLAVGMALAVSGWMSERMRAADVILSVAFVAAGLIGWGLLPVRVLALRFSKA